MISGTMRVGTVRDGTYLEMGGASCTKSSLYVSCTVRGEVVVALAATLGGHGQRRMEAPVVGMGYKMRGSGRGCWRGWWR